MKGYYRIIFTCLTICAVHTVVIYSMNTDSSAVIYSMNTDSSAVIYSMNTDSSAVIYSMNTDSFVVSLRRFIARRGKPEIIHSYNATNFTNLEKGN